MASKVPEKMLAAQVVEVDTNTCLLDLGTLPDDGNS